MCSLPATIATYPTTRAFPAIPHKPHPANHANSRIANSKGFTRRPSGRATCITINPGSTSYDLGESQATRPRSVVTSISKGFFGANHWELNDVARPGTLSSPAPSLLRRLRMCALPRASAS